MDVSIIIVNYNTISILTDALDSIFAKTDGIEYEIIVVDNNSNDNSKIIITEKYGDKIIYLGLSENIGFGRANNEGAKIAKGRYLFFLNPDTILQNNAIYILSNYLDSNTSAGCCGGNLLDNEERPIHSFKRYITPLFEEINKLFLWLPVKFLYGLNAEYNYTNKPLKVAYITGADLMMRKWIFDKLQGFDPDFFMYSEEAELQYRVSKMRYKIISVPSARIFHLEGKSFSDKDYRFRNRIAAQNILSRKIYNNSILPLTIIDILSVLNIKLRLSYFTLFREKEKIAVWQNIYKTYKSVKK
jgi:GT2 family glycosyltransferase